MKSLGRVTTLIHKRAEELIGYFPPVTAAYNIFASLSPLSLFRGLPWRRAARAGAYPPL